MCGAAHLVYWFWGFWEGLQFGHCLLLAMGNLFGATSDSQFVDASTGLGYTLEDQAAHWGWFLPALGPVTGQQESLGTLRSASAWFCWLAIWQAEPLKEPLEVMWVRAGAQRVGVLETLRVVFLYFLEGKSASEIHGKVRGMPKATQLSYLQPLVCPDLYSLAKAADSSVCGGRSTHWGENEAREFYTFV